MKKEIIELIRPEITDEMIDCAKTYEQLGEAVDLAEELSDKLRNMQGYSTEYKQVEKVVSELTKYMGHFQNRVQDQVALQRGIKLAMLQKAIK